jgi:exonuclease III
MRVVVVNCQSAKRKKPQLESLAEATHADIIGCESLLDSSIQNNEIFPAGYEVYRRDRPTGNHGGVFILVSSRFESCQPQELASPSDSESELLWVQVKTRGSKPLYICSLYLPPASQRPGCLQVLDDSLQKIPKGSHIWVGGDFNLPDVD